MQLKDLLAGIVTGPLADAAVTAVSSDSRAVQPGTLFVALAGARTDGARFIADALAKGAVAVVAGAAGPDPRVHAVAEPRLALSRISGRFFERQPETMVAVTGTAGKTSVAAFVRQIFAHAGYPAASIGTTGVTSPKGEHYGALTTPDPITLHRILAELADDGVTHAAMEASSHGLDQFRLDGVRLKAGGFTNLSRDHLDYHPDEAHYFAAKMRLFDAVLPADGVAVVDMDSDFGQKAADHARRRGLRLIGVGRAGAELRLVETEDQPDGQVLMLDGLGGRCRIKIPLIGTFQASNTLVAAGLAIGAGVAPATALAALSTLKGASGRLDLVGRTAAGAPVFVDYAHKPGALEKVLEALRPATAGRLIVAIGCGGDRDAGKRPIMGEIARRLADVVIVTDDNPRSEDPAAIRRAVLAGAGSAAIEIGDRMEAIRHGVSLLQAGDTFVVAGKGHETGQIVGDTVLPFSDHDAVRAALAGLDP